MYASILEASRRKVVIVRPGVVGPGAERRTESGRPWPVLFRGAPPADGRGACGAWRFRPQVTLVVQDDAARVLDTQGGSFHALDPTGTRMLLTTLEAGPEAMVRALARECRVPEEQVRGDWVALVQALHQAGLTEPVQVRPAIRRLPGGWRLWVRLTLAWLSFALLGWERTLNLWRRPVPPVVWGPDAGEAVLAAVDGLVRRVAGRHPLNPQCKERALVSWHLLRRMGLPARLVMGVMLYPFAAHAWAECQGRVVGDDPGRCEQFVPVAIYE
jgi:transglutaminase superfamily protein/coenzyme PQQ synthesis protein D (PqqD)